jgi:hypothetical protein
MFDDVFELAAFLGRRFEAQNLVIVRDGSAPIVRSRCGHARRGPGDPVTSLAAIDLDLAVADGRTLPLKVLRRSVVVGLALLERTDRSGRLLRCLVDLSRVASLTIVTCPLTDLDGITASGSTAAGTWSFDAFERLLVRADFEASLAGVARDVEGRSRTGVAIADHCPLAAARAVPEKLQTPRADGHIQRSGHRVPDGHQAARGRI